MFAEIPKAIFLKSVQRIKEHRATHFQVETVEVPMAPWIHSHGSN